MPLTARYMLPINDDFPEPTGPKNAISDTLVKVSNNNVGCKDTSSLCHWYPYFLAAHWIIIRRFPYGRGIRLQISSSLS